MAQRALGKVFLRQTPSVNSRAFSGSTRCLKEPIPEFTPTSTPELDSLLAKFREKLFIPSSLSPRHQALMFKKKYADQLNNQRVMVNLRGRDEQVRLQPMPITEQPSNQDFKTAIKSMSTYEDWCNLQPLLIGLKDSKRVLQPDRLEWLIRKACDAGKHGIILECIKKSKITGLELRGVGAVRILYQGFHAVAQSSGFSKGVVERSLDQAQQAAALIQPPKKHKGAVVEEDARKQPDVIGVLLELSASRALQSFDGNDQNGEVASYATRTLGTWPAGNFRLPDEAKWSDANDKLKEMMPLWNGMKLALKVKEVNADGNLRANLTRRIRELEPKIEAAMKVISDAELSYTPINLTRSKELFQQ
ncbi:hypothetical protein FQN54_005337 [Arachnomyces sp. PD_36]|nr:hypothetical protein FQN54_005337 [Arachnomyces sp. PD_36]